MFTETGNALFLAMIQRKESEKKILFEFVSSVCHCVVFLFAFSRKLYVIFCLHKITFSL